MHHGRTKHIDVKYHFIRDMVPERQVKLEFGTTHDQLVDVMTKVLGAEISEFSNSTRSV